MGKKIAIGFISTLLFLNSALTFAQNTIYETVEPDGSARFSDMPEKNSRKITLENDTGTVDNTSASKNTPSQDLLQTIAPIGNASLSQAGETSVPVAYEIKIVSPQDQTTFQDQSPISVSVDVQPQLLPDDQLQLLVDGKPYGNPEHSTTLSIGELARGTHQVQAGIFDSKTGTIGKVSLPITIYKHQASTLLPVKK